MYHQAIEGVYPLISDVPKDPVACRKAILQGKIPTYQADVRIRSKSGGIKWLCDTSIPIRDDKTGKIIGATGILQDVTARKNAEEAHLRSEENYRTLVENINDVLCTMDLNGFITYISPSVRILLDYEPGEIVGERFNKFVHKDDLAVMQKRFHEIMGGHIKARDYRIHRKNGEIRWVRVSSKPLMENGMPIGLYGVLSDITEKKREESLREAIYKISESAYKADNLDYLFKSIHDVVGELMSAQNFYIAIYDADTKMISFPYFVDEYDEAPEPKKLGKGLTEYVLRKGKPLLASPEVFEKLPGGARPPGHHRDNAGT